MKKILVVSSILGILLNFSVKAQGLSNEMPENSLVLKPKAKKSSAFYVKVYGNYGVLSPGGFKGLFSNYSLIAGAYDAKNSFGQGIRSGFGLGVVLNEFINIGIDGEYINATATESQASSNTNVTYPYQVVTVIPNVTFKAISTPEYYVYNRLGLVVGIPLDLGYTISTTSNNSTYVSKYAIPNKMGFGYQAAFGIQFKVAGNLRAFAEITASNVLLKGETVTMKSYTVNQKQTANSDIGKVQTLNLDMPLNSVGVGTGLFMKF